MRDLKCTLSEPGGISGASMSGMSGGGMFTLLAEGPLAAEPVEGPAYPPK